jgi:mannosyltransferase OCH1-like enzyme
MPDRYWQWYKNSMAVLGDGWTHVLWTNTPIMKAALTKKAEAFGVMCDIRVFNIATYDERLMIIIKDYLKRKKWGAASDCMRLVINYDQGGLYWDTDYEMKQTILPLHYTYDFYGAIEPLSFYVGNAIFASKAHHPVFREALSLLIRNHYETPRYITNLKTDVLKIVHTTGPALLTTAYARAAGRHRDIAFAPAVLYSNADGIFPRNRSYITKPGQPLHPASFGVHYWELSWVNK